MNIGTILYTWLYGKKVATDEYDNTYYCNSNNFNDPLLGIQSKLQTILFNVILHYYPLINIYFEYLTKFSL